MTKLLMKDCAWIALCSLARDGRDTERLVLAVF